MTTYELLAAVSSPPEEDWPPLPPPPPAPEYNDEDDVADEELNARADDNTPSPRRCWSRPDLPLPVLLALLLPEEEEKKNSLPRFSQPDLLLVLPLELAAVFR